MSGANGVSCAPGAGSLNVTASSARGQVSLRFSRFGTDLRVSSGSSVACDVPLADVSTVSVVNDAFLGYNATIDESGGPLGAGSGASAGIKFDLTGMSGMDNYFAVVGLSGQANAIRAGKTAGGRGVDLNGDGDVDVANPGATIWRFDGGAEADDISLGGGAGFVSPLTPYQWYINGNDGDDRIDSSPGNGYGGVAGGDGDDTVYLRSGSSIPLDGGPGSDTLDLSRLDGPGDVSIAEARRTGFENLAGGPAPDTLRGDDGDNFINSRDGESDTIICGGGFDTVASDPLGVDRIAGDCEQIDPAGEPRPAPLPVTTFTRSPEPETTDRTPVFEFGSSVPGSTFECDMDGAGWSPCVSPYVAGPLEPGPHRLRVKATSPRRTTERDPATVEFTVLASAPVDPVDPQPAEFTYSVIRTTIPSGTRSLLRRGAKVRAFCSDSCVVRTRLTVPRRIARAANVFSPVASQTRTVPGGTHELAVRLDPSVRMVLRDRSASLTGVRLHVTITPAAL